MVLSYNLTVAEALQRASAFLEDKGIHHAPIKDYWQRVFDWTFTELILNMNKKTTQKEIDRFNQVLLRLSEDEPIQYILGYTYFANKKYLVSPATLIPREDTYGLIDLAIKELSYRSQARVLDLGTGSGIIAIEIAKQVPGATITAIDISGEALQVAADNARIHGVQLTFIHSNLFEAFNHEESFDLIVSNPPYISYDEIALMDSSVLRYEPKIALFADNQGLAIYQKIAHNAKSFIRSNGTILLEIGFKQGEKVRRIFETEFPKAHIQVLKDLNGHDRYVKVALEKE